MIFLYCSKLDDVEYSIPALNAMPTLENVLTDMDGDSDFGSVIGIGQPPTPTLSMDDASPKLGTILRHVMLQGVSSQVGSAAVRMDMDI